MVSEMWQPTRNEKVTVGATSIVVANPRTNDNERSVITIRNTSDDDTKIITVHVGEGTAVAETGIVLQRNESFTDANETGYKSWQGAFTAICAVAGGQLSIFER